MPTDKKEDDLALFLSFRLECRRDQNQNNLSHAIVASQFVSLAMTMLTCCSVSGIFTILVYDVSTPALAH